jgi:hypothetical protein
MIKEVDLKSLNIPNVTLFREENDRISSNELYSMINCLTKLIQHNNK